MMGLICFGVWRRKGNAVGRGRGELRGDEECGRNLGNVKGSWHHLFNHYTYLNLEIIAALNMMLYCDDGQYTSSALSIYCS